ncbi:MAG: DUF126 domain-containing protein [Selenomonadaceae bacterium]|nr:DUF126 domain-containing protein [Selenomonadaceae bacterium]MDY2685969.1 DUF126 domain-containing protein [Selenomonadaceae bacterium]
MKTFSCHKIAGGKASGELLYSEDPICFYLIDPKTGKIIEKQHCLYGQCVTGKILVFPYGKGSSVVQADGMYQLKLTGKGPAAIIVRDADTTLAASAIIFDLPLVNRMPEEFYQAAASGKLDGKSADLNVETGTLCLMD